MVNPVPPICTHKLDSPAGATGQGKAWETLTPFCAGVYVNTCPTDREGQVSQPLSSDFPTKNRSPRTKPRSTGVYHLFSFLQPLVTSCVWGWCVPLLWFDLVCQRKSPFNSGFVPFTRIWPYGTFMDRNSRYKHYFLLERTSSNMLLFYRHINNYYI